MLKYYLKEERRLKNQKPHTTKKTWLKCSLTWSISIYLGITQVFYLLSNWRTSLSLSLSLLSHNQRLHQASRTEIIEVKSLLPNTNHFRRSNFKKKKKRTYATPQNPICQHKNTISALITTIYGLSVFFNPRSLSSEHKNLIKIEMKKSERFHSRN